jgi:CxxC motif-containing protein (DUF1111 family)
MLLRPLYLLLLGLGLVTLYGCDTLMTSAPEDQDLLDAPLAGLSRDLNAIFLDGDERFAKVFRVQDGLGPIFNNVSCAGCHPGDGRGTPELGFPRISTNDDLAQALGGPQIQDKAIPGNRPETLPDGVLVTFRLPPPVFGVGLIEAIPEAAILALADPEDNNNDGISGRPNWVTPPDWVPTTHVGGGGGLQLGRFSRKAQVAALVQQVAEAYQQDMGITSDFLPVENLNRQLLGTAALGDLVADPEIPASTVLSTTMYVRLLSPPGRGKITDQVRRGEQLFAQIQCAACHTPSLSTGPHPIAALNQVEVHLYSDLLLHDMGPGLADGRPDGDATGSEWRTAPLWGTRLAGEFLDGEEFYLHDGRAGSLDEAVRLHGGESEAAKNAYEALPTAEQQTLLAFLSSL